ncbi:MAG TPA: hypothetical protein VKS60_16155 [Stellaceae bacterium]|nr:hypothetical protein [Stellaceae bacterium]
MLSILVRIALVLLVAYAVYRFLAGPKPTNRPVPPAPGPRSVEELTECGVCHSYIAASAGRCGRPDCPRRA